MTLLNAQADGAFRDYDPSTGEIFKDVVFNSTNGNDVYGVVSKDTVICEGENGGIDTVWSCVNDYTLSANVENGISTFGNTMYGNSLSNVLSVYGSMSTKLFGYDGDDTIYGGGGDDALDGGNGADVINGGDGRDAIYGGLGNDLLVGGEGADAIYGGEGINTLSGGNGDDTLVGGNTNGIGGIGIDYMDGGAGNDYLLGNGGCNVITTGEGCDIVAFNANSYKGDNFNATHVVDFTSGQDVLMFTGQDYAGLDGKALTANDIKFFSTEEEFAALDCSDAKLLVSNTGAIYYNSNGSSLGLGTLGNSSDSGPIVGAIADVTSSKTLAISDFMIV